MTLYVGTSGYSYQKWKGSFYPEHLPAKEMLSYYARSFRTVEINNTFYRMPKAAVMQSWADQVPAGFRFALKAPQSITHAHRLLDAEEPVSYFLEVAGVLKERLGAVLFQTPPGLKRDLPRLKTFLAVLPPGLRVAMEFRDQSWFDEEILALLRHHGVALCIAEAEGGLEVPVVATAEWGYLRLRLPEYGVADLKRWAERIRQLGWKDTFVFFKHEESGKGPVFAKRFLEVASPSPSGRGSG